MNVIPDNATLDYYKVVDMLRKHLNVVMAECNQLRSVKFSGLSEEIRQRSLIRMEECRDTYASLIEDLNNHYCELKPSCF